MACEIRSQAWITYVGRDDEVTQSLVLAESLRRTGTIRALAAITSKGLCNDARFRLRSCYDFLLNFEDVFEESNQQLAKYFAFSLTFFSKCIFVSANNIILENIDYIFEDFDYVAWDISETWDVFLLSPNAAFFNFLCRDKNNANNWNLSNILKCWIQTDEGRIAYPEIYNNCMKKLPIWKLSLANGQLVLNRERSLVPCILQFTDCLLNSEQIINLLKSFAEKQTTGSMEMKLIQESLNILDSLLSANPNSRLEFRQAYKTEPIAIVGMSCRLPGANNLEEFWDLLFAGQDAISKPPAFRWGKMHAIYREPIARLSFLLGLTGPSVATESGCSSAIVAVDMAVKRLRLHEINIGFAAGVNLLLHPFDSSIIPHVVSPNGHCKTFDAKADGFGRAEGCGVLVLKRLSDAMRDRDHIWALIRGSALAQEGVSRSMGTPTIYCEALAMQLALKNAGVRPEQVSYVEAHGTGTSVGDPMEMRAIAKAYYAKERTKPLIIGSVKTNVGHTESCSGITGIIKSVLSLQHQLIPKHLNLVDVNPEIHLNSIPAEIPIEAIPWPKVVGQPRIAGVSSFGITGTDGHVILEEAPDYHYPKIYFEVERPLHIVKFSAKSIEALDELLLSYVQFLRKNKTITFADFAYTANVGRASFGHRAFLIASNPRVAEHMLCNNNLMQKQVREKPGYKKKICFLFPGQGSQYPEMGKQLYITSPVFRFHFDQCDMVLKNVFNITITPVLWNSEPKSKEINRTIYSQVSIFVIQYALLKLWESWGIKPDYVLGHSLGEFCAAVATRVLDFEDALTLVAERSRLIDTLPRGSMLVVNAGYSVVSQLMENMELDVAALNYADQTVVAGDTAKVEEFRQICSSADLKTTLLNASHAFHSRHMDPILNHYRKIVRTIHLEKNSTATCQFISSLEGKLLENPGSELSADYWIRQTRQPVSFVEACRVLKQLECDVYLELGAHPVLSTFVKYNMENFPILCYASLKRGRGDWETLLTSLGNLYLDGYPVNWEGFDKPYSRVQICRLPMYPFGRRSHWVNCQNASSPLIHPLLGRLVPNATTQTVFENRLSLKTVPYLSDHCIEQMIIFPGAGFTEMCLTAGYSVSHRMTECLERPPRAIAVKNVKIITPLNLRENRVFRMQTVVKFSQAEGLECHVYNHTSFGDDDNLDKKIWVQHATAAYQPDATDSNFLREWDEINIESFMATVQPLDGDTFYKEVDNTGLKFGDSFRNILQYWPISQGSTNLGNVLLVVEMKCPTDQEKYLVHPVVIDTMMQAAVLAENQDGEGSKSSLRVPVSIGKFTLVGDAEICRSKAKEKTYCCLA